MFKSPGFLAYKTVVLDAVACYIPSFENRVAAALPEVAHGFRDLSGRVSVLAGRAEETHTLVEAAHLLLRNEMPAMMREVVRGELERCQGSSRANDVGMVSCEWGS